MIMSQFEQHLQDARSSIRAAAACDSQLEHFSRQERRQVLTEILLAIDCLLHAAQPSPNHD